MPTDKPDKEGFEPVREPVIRPAPPVEERAPAPPAKKRYLQNNLNSNQTVTWAGGSQAATIPRKSSVAMDELPKDIATQPQVVARLKSGDFSIYEA